MPQDTEKPDNVSAPEPDAAEKAADALSRPIPPEKLINRREIKVEIVADDDERAALVGELDLVSLDALALSGDLAPHEARGWAFTGRLEATLAQRCVVTLEPAPVRIAEQIERFWLPEADIAAREAELAAAADAPIDPEMMEEGEEPEPLPEILDMGVVAREALALALDPYPRAPGVAFEQVLAGPPGVAPLTDEDAKPFAGLAALKEKLNGPSAPKTGKDDEDAS